MIIQFNTDKTIKGDEKSSEHFSLLISEGLKKYSSHITRIEAHVSDENGSKDAVNTIRCLLEARLEGKKPMAVTCQDNTIELAVSGAINK
jgi:hypothetical protein